MATIGELVTRVEATNVGLKQVLGQSAQMTAAYRAEQNAAYQSDRKTLVAALREQQTAIADNARTKKASLDRALQDEKISIERHLRITGRLQEKARVDALAAVQRFATEEVGLQLKYGRLKATELGRATSDVMNQARKSAASAGTAAGQAYAQNMVAAVRTSGTAAVTGGGGGPIVPPVLNPGGGGWPGRGRGTSGFQVAGRNAAPAVVSLAYGFESLARSAAAAEGGIRAASRSVATFAAGFGVGGVIVTALISGGMALYEFWNGQRKEVEETRRKFQSELADMARGHDLIGVSKLRATIFSGDQFAGIEGKREDESDAAFKGRALGIRGLTGEVARLKAVIGPRPLFDNVYTTTPEARKQLRELKALEEQLTILQAKEAKIKPVFDLLMGQQQSQSRTDLLLARDKADAKIDPVAKLEEMLSQIEQTRNAMDKLGLDSHALEDSLSNVWIDANVLLREHGGLLDKNGLRLREIIARTMELKSVQAAADSRVARFEAFKASSGPIASRMRFQVQEPIASAGDQQFTVSHVDISTWKSRTQEFVDGLQSAGTSVRGFFANFGKSLLSAMNPLRIFAEFFAELGNALRPALEPLAPIFAQLAAVIGRALGPIVTALAPVLQELVPIIGAIMQVLSPIIRALVPIIAAFLPLIRALFPIFKLVAIAATYIGQAFGLAASLVLRASGNIIIVFGTILKAFAQAVDALPFVSARGAIDAAQGVIDFGKALLTSSDEFKKSAEEMAKAREEIKGVTIDTTTSIDRLGEAAAETADALKNVPMWWKVNLEVWRATNVRGTTSAGGPRAAPRGPAGGTPIPVIPPLSVPPTSGGASGGGPRAAPTGGATFSFGAVNINGANKDGATLLKEMIREAQRISQATFGTTTRWPEVVF